MTPSIPAVSPPKIRAGPQGAPVVHPAICPTFLDTKLYNTIQGIAPKLISAPKSANNVTISERPNTEPIKAIPTATVIAAPSMSYK